MFYYFAYGSCMCPVDLARSLQDKATHLYCLGPATLKGYRLGFYFYSPRQQSGALDIVPDPNAQVEGVLYQLPDRLSEALDIRELGYRHERVAIDCGGKRYQNVRTYTVIEKLPTELAPNDWYIQVVLRGAATCRLSESYCWRLFNHMYHLQQRQQRQVPLLAA